MLGLRSSTCWSGNCEASIVKMGASDRAPGAGVEAPAEAQAGDVNPMLAPSHWEVSTA